MFGRFVFPGVAAAAAASTSLSKYKVARTEKIEWTKADDDKMSVNVEHGLASQKILPIDPIKRWSTVPQMPPPVERRYPARVIIPITSETRLMNLGRGVEYPFWTFNETCPGPVMRVRVGDTLEIRFENNDENGLAHNIDFHAVTGPGGGAAINLAESGEKATMICKMLQPGLFMYHCAADPVPVHIMNGMYGLILVEPEDPLPKVDREYCVVQSEFFCDPDEDDPTLLEPSYFAGLEGSARYCVWNGREGSLVDEPLLAKQGERVRLYVGNMGPNMISSFHVIGWIFDKVYREGDLVSAPARCIQTTTIPAGGAAVVESDCFVPGTFALVDHAIFRLDKGCVGFLKVVGRKRPDLYYNPEMENGKQFAEAA